MHSKLMEKAKQALDKRASLGEDIDLERFKKELPDEHSYQEDLSMFSGEEREKLIFAGIDTSEKERSASFIQKDQSVVHCKVKQDGIELLGMADALKKYDWMKDYWHKLVPVDMDKYTAFTQLQEPQGYFIRSLKGIKTTFPVQACLYLEDKGRVQSVHNIIIAEENSELHIITGCTTSPKAEFGAHLGISEFFIKKGAKVTFSMIHNWAENIEVRPRTGTLVEEGGLFLSNYVCMKPVKSLQMYPTAYLKGKGAVARYNSILVATPGSTMDVGSRVYMSVPESKAEIISRTISTGGKIIARGNIIGEVAGCKGHLECRGLILDGKGQINAIPELEAMVEGVELSHEAAVGKIAQEEIEYLMARGLSENEATATIVRGFLNVDIEGLPPSLKQEIDKAIADSEKDLF